MTSLSEGQTSILRGQTSLSALWPGRDLFDPLAALGADLLGWWDALHDDLITQAGGLVSSWRDRVAGYDLTSSGGAMPAYAATGFNGGPELSFDGVDDVLTLAGVPFPTAAVAAEIWILLRQAAPASDATVRLAFAYGGAAAASRRVQRSVVTGVNRAVGSVGNGTSGVEIANAAIDMSGRHVVRLETGATASQLTVDGGTPTSSAVVPATNTNRTRIGASTATSTPSNYWQGGIAAVLVTNPLSAEKAGALQTYLAKRKG